MKRFTGLLLSLLLLLPTLALAGWDGSTEAAETLTIHAPASGTLTWQDLQAGQRIAEGETLGSVAPTKTFATVDGTVSRVTAAAGEKVEGTLLEIAPTSRYTVRCSVKGAEQGTETTLVHSGEVVYLRCTRDGSHLALGRITTIDNLEYVVEVLGGELYVGEVVNVYRTEDFLTVQKVGYGTVLAADTIPVQGSGFITRLRVQEGDSVQRGQWLFSTLDVPDGTVTAPAGGIVTALAAETGSSVQQGQALAQIAVSVRLTAQMDAADAALLQPGAAYTYTRADEDHGTRHVCTVLEIASTEADGLITVTFLPEETDLPIGLSVEIE